MTDQTSPAAVSERKAAEQEYSITAFDYVRNPVGSRDWTLYWDGWQAALKHAQQAVESFQQRVQPWMMECFGPKIAADTQERNHRFLEESLELVQACGCTQSEAHQLVNYVYGRPVGDKSQEVGGVMVTLAALCLAQGLDMHQAGETELARIWTKVEKIRAKQAAKPKHSPLPMAVERQVDKPDIESTHAARAIAAYEASGATTPWTYLDPAEWSKWEKIADAVHALSKEEPT